MKRGRKTSIVNIKRKPGKKKNKNKKISLMKKFVHTFFLCVFVVLVACLGIGAGMYAAIANEINDMNVQELALTRSSMVYYTDEDGNSQEAAVLYSDGNCIWVDSNEIPQIMKEAIVSIEDERFYEHSGVDIKRTAGAVFGYIKEKLGMGKATYGGSTITQQVIKNITQEKDRTPIRKVKEMMRAVALERQLSKDEILTMYLNVIFLANNCYGVEAASNIYFDKPAKDLTLTEAALIAGITQRPSYFDPIRNPENATAKRNTVLLKMYELGKITETEYEEAIAADIGLDEEHTQNRRNVYSYFIDTVVNDVIRDLQVEKGYSETFATQQVFSGGLKIYTTMDMKIQKAMESVFEDSSNFSGGAAKAQSAMVIMDPKNGQIKGIIGGKGEKVDSRGLNRATQTTRQPGSSLKPLSVYAPAIEKRIVTASTSVVDEPISIKDWEPKNSYSGFKGKITVKKAVEISANIPAIKVLQKVGLGTSYNYVTQKFNLSTVTEADRDFSPLALGGLTNGVSVKEMAAAYCTFANEGYYTEPYTYTKVLDSANRVLLEKNPQPQRAINSTTAYLMSELLYGVVNGSSGTGRLAKLSNMPTYGKTGTTNNNYDKWFVGYTPHYVGAVWFGFDQQQSISRAGIRETISIRLWKKVMDKVHDGLSGEKIGPTADTVRAYVCSETGELAREDCEGVTEYFASGSAPDVYCDAQHKVEEEIVEEIPPATQEPVQESTPPQQEQDTPIEIPNGDTQTIPPQTPENQENQAQVDEVVNIE